MKSATVPVFATCCRLSQLLSHARAELAYQRTVPPTARPAPAASLAAAAASLPFIPSLG